MIVFGTKVYYGKIKGATLVINNNILVHPDATKREINQTGDGKQEADFHSPTEVS